MKHLFALSFLAAVGVASAQSAAPTASKPLAPKALTRVLIDRDELRSIEVVTDRHESVSQLFARRQIALASPSLINGKGVNNWSQLRISRPTAAFISYPLYNDDGFQMKAYGQYIELAPPSSNVLNLFKNTPSPLDSHVFVVLAFDDISPSGALATNRNRRAHLIGRVQVSGHWRPENEKALLAFSPPAR